MSKIEVRLSNIEKMNTKAKRHWYGSLCHLAYLL